MNGFDLIAIVMVGLAAKRGFKRGLAVEFYRLFRMVVAIFAGTSLYRMFSDALSSLLNIQSGYSDPALFVAAMVIAWKLLQRLRIRMEALILARTPAHIQATGGAVSAGIKTFVFVIAVVTSVSLSSWLPGHTWIAKESAIGKIVQPFIEPSN